MIDLDSRAKVFVDQGNLIRIHPIIKLSLLSMAYVIILDSELIIIKGLLVALHHYLYWNQIS